MQFFPSQDTFELDQGHVTKNQPITVLVLLMERGKVFFSYTFSIKNNML